MCKRPGLRREARARILKDTEETAFKPGGWGRAQARGLPRPNSKVTRRPPSDALDGAPLQRLATEGSKGGPQALQPTEHTASRKPGPANWTGSQARTHSAPGQHPSLQSPAHPSGNDLIQSFCHPPTGPRVLSSLPLRPPGLTGRGGERLNEGGHWPPCTRKPGTCKHAKRQIRFLPRATQVHPRALDRYGCQQVAAFPFLSTTLTVNK